MSKLKNKIFGDKDWLVVDDVLNKEQVDDIEHKLTNNIFPWYLPTNKEATAIEDISKFKNNEIIKDHLQMVHNFFEIDDYENTYGYSEYKEHVLFITNRLMHYFDINRLNIRRAKANLQKQFTDNKKEYINIPHFDMNNEYSHFNILYYVNDSDGDTFLFDGYDLNVVKQVSPKKGRFFIFKGNYLHAGQHPINSWGRVVINMNFEL